MLTQFVFKKLANMTMKWTDLMINGVVICLVKDAFNIVSERICSALFVHLYLCSYPI